MTFLLALDQGTTSTRALVVDDRGEIHSTAQLPHRQSFPSPGRVEHDPLEILANTRAAIGRALDDAGLDAGDLTALGITNQRETVVVWDRGTGLPIHPAIVWQDARTVDRVARLQADGVEEEVSRRTGLRLSPYFSATKLAWILDAVPRARERAGRGELLAGTIDTWLVWNLTGGPDGGQHVTDVTNASRTLLMDIRSCRWDPWLCDLFAVPGSVLPQIRSSSEVVGHASLGDDVTSPRVPIGGILGDQQAAAFGQAAFDVGDSKMTYGSGGFLMVNTGEHIVRAPDLLSTVGYQRVGERPRYALEGSIAVIGSLVSWLRELRVVDSAEELGVLAESVSDAGGAVIVPAFGGLLAPHWRPDARGAILGLSSFVSRAHLARAALEAAAFQTDEVVAAAERSLGRPLRSIRVDGGMAVSDLLLQIQADVLGVPIVRTASVEATARGAAFAAGLATDVWRDTDELRDLVRVERTWTPAISDGERDRRREVWGRAVRRTFAWV